MDAVEFLTRRVSEGPSQDRDSLAYGRVVLIIVVFRSRKNYATKHGIREAQGDFVLSGTTKSTRPYRPHLTKLFIFNLPDPT